MTKNSIRQAFSKQVVLYDEHAIVQHQAAVALDREIAAFVANTEPHVASPVQSSWQHIVDLGCGTGFLTKLLAQRSPSARVTACDFSSEMLEKTKHVLHDTSLSRDSRHDRFIVADAELLTTTEPTDLIASNLCPQWFDNFERSIKHHLQQTAILAWSTLLAGTFAEWIAAHQARSLQSGIRVFMTEAQLDDLVEQLPAKRKKILITSKIMHYPNAHMFVRSLRSIGAVVPNLTYRPVYLRPMLREFANGFDAEYRIAMILLER